MKTFLLLCAAALFTALSAGALAQSTATQRTTPKQEPAGEPAARARGHIVYHDRCEICHFSDSAASKIGPGLKGLYTRGTFGEGAKADDASVEKWVWNGSKNMPPLKGVLTPQQMRDLLAYLKTI